jgi:hypothetical protein
MLQFRELICILIGSQEATVSTDGDAVTITEPQTSSTGIVLTAREQFARCEAEVAELGELTQRLGQSRALALNSGREHEIPEIDEELAAVGEDMKKAKARLRQWLATVSLVQFVGSQPGRSYGIEAWLDTAALWLTRDTGQLAEARIKCANIRRAEHQLSIGCFDEAAVISAMRSIDVLEKSLFAQARSALTYMVGAGQCIFIHDVVTHLWVEL